MLREQMVHPAAASLVEVPLHPGAGIEIVQHYRRSAMSIRKAGMPRVSMGSILSNGGASGSGTWIPGWHAARLIDSSRVSFGLFGAAAPFSFVQTNSRSS